MNTRGKGRREPWLEVLAGASAQPLDSEVEQVHQLVAAPQLLGLVAIEGDVERAAGVVTDLQLAVSSRARLREPLARLGRRPAPGASAPPRPRSPRRPGRASPPPHGRLPRPGGRTRAPERAPPAAPPAMRRPARSPHRRPPRRPRPPGRLDRAGGPQRDDDVVALACWPLSVLGHGRLLRLRPAVPRHHSCAGITRIRFRRSAAAMPPSQPQLRGSRCAVHGTPVRALLRYQMRGVE